MLFLLYIQFFHNIGFWSWTNSNTFSCNSEFHSSHKAITRKQNFFIYFYTGTRCNLCIEKEECLTKKLLMKCQQLAKKPATLGFKPSTFGGKWVKYREWKPQIAYSTSMTARPPSFTSYLCTLKLNKTLYMSGFFSFTSTLRALSSCQNWPAHNENFTFNQNYPARSVKS